MSGDSQKTGSQRWETPYCWSELSKHLHPDSTLHTTHRERENHNNKNKVNTGSEKKTSEQINIQTKLSCPYKGKHQNTQNLSSLHLFQCKQPTSCFQNHIQYISINHSLLTESVINTNINHNHCLLTTILHLNCITLL